MKQFRWSDDKNEQLEAERQVSFQQVLQAIQAKQILDIVEHPDQAKYPSQRIFIIAMNEYVYLVPFVEDDEVIFLKTIIPSRKMKKKYLGG
ncbi:MAG: hypothetical protein WA783_00635 [Phormidesmis sp.]